MTAEPAEPVTVHPVLGLPEVRTGDCLADLLAHSCGIPQAPTVLVVSSKVVSKAAGLRLRGTLKDEVVARQSTRVVAERSTAQGVTRIVEAIAGPVMAAAGVDASNTGEPDTLLLLPVDADRAAHELRSRLLACWALPSQAPFAVIISDTAGRPWRAGVGDFALGCAGLRPLLDHRGGSDADGRPLSVTVRAVADEIAAAADLVKGKARGIPAALVHGLDPGWFDPDAAGARSVLRRGPGDWFALGHVEAVRSALAVPPGSELAAQIGIPRAGGEEAFEARLARLVTLALHTVLGGAIDVEPVGDDGARLVCSADDDLETGLLVARVLVAAHAEAMTATRSGRTGVRVRGAPGAPGA